jgi:hypothetical protein
MSQQTYQGGALYELVARGVKDSYFYEDSAESVNPFSWKYNKYPAVQTETRTVRPLNAVSRASGSAGNRTILIDIDQYGDILQTASIHVRLPTWIPKPYSDSIKRGLVYPTDNSGVSYGYNSGIGYALFEKIEILQDNIILQEVTGDALYVLSRHKGSWNAHHYADELAGVYDDSSALAVQRSADPDRTYIIPLPFITDFPLVALRGQRFRVRLTLRDIKDIVISVSTGVGGPDSPKPKPWLVPSFTLKTSQADPGTVFKPLSLAEMSAPEITIEMVQTYLSNDDRAALAKATYVIPYKRYFSHNKFSLGPLDYAPFDLDTGATPAVVRNYDGLYFVERIITAVRNTRDIQANRLTSYNNVDVSSGDYIVGLQSAYGSTIRDDTWGPLVLNFLAQHAHEKYSSAIATLIQNYGLEHEKKSSVYPNPTSYSSPAGLNYSEAVDPNLRLILNNIQADYYGQKSARLDILLETTGFYAVENGRGGLLFGT